MIKIDTTPRDRSTGNQELPEMLRFKGTNEKIILSNSFQY